MGGHIESADRPYESLVAAEDIHTGELVGENGSDKFRRADAQNENRLSFMATRPHTGDWIADDEDATSNDLYESADDDRVPALPLVDGDVIKVWTPEDTGGNESAPSAGHGDLVGVIDTSAGTLSSTDEYKGRVVQEGYTDGESTPVTYNRSNSNFIALGRVYKDSTSSFDDILRVRVNRENLQ